MNTYKLEWNKSIIDRKKPVSLRSNTNQVLKVSLITLASLLSLFIITILIYSTSKQNLDLRQQASNPSGTVVVTLQTTTPKLNSADEIKIAVTMNTNDLQIDGLQLTLIFPNHVINPKALTTNLGSLKIVHQQVVEQTNNKIMKVLLTNTKDGSGFRNNLADPVMNIVFKTNQRGKMSIIADNENSLATIFGSNPPKDELLPIQPLELTIVDDPYPPSPTPTLSSYPSITPTPGDDQKPSPTPAVPSPTPVVPSPTPTVPSPTPTSQINKNQNNLIIKFLHQGISKETNAELETMVWLIPANIYIDKLNEDQLIKHAIKTKSKTMQNELGMETSIIPLEPFPDNTKVVVLVKTNNSLRRNLGTILTSSQNDSSNSFSKNSIVADFRKPELELLVGDFVQTPISEFNKISILDISSILQHYTKLQIPVTPQIEKYDVNFDRVISIFDLAIVLSNYTKLEVHGD